MVYKGGVPNILSDVDAVGQRKGTLERTVSALGHMAVVVVLVLLVALLALDRQHPAGDGDENVLFLESGQFGGSVAARAFMKAASV